MTNKVKVNPQTVAEERCPHHWVIESAMGAATSRGVCRLCGAEKEFRNSWYDLNGGDWFNKKTEADELPEEEIGGI